MKNSKIGPGTGGTEGQYPAKGPGKSAETRMGLKGDMYPSGKTPSAPKNVRNRTRGQEEDQGT